MATDAPGNIYIPNNSGGITKITPGGTQSVIATGLSPNGIAVDEPVTYTPPLVLAS